MKTFSKYIEMALPRKEDSDAVWYHGTSSEAAGKKIIAEGKIDPGLIAIAPGKRGGNFSQRRNVLDGQLSYRPLSEKNHL